jgi:hypothetical protein
MDLRKRLIAPFASVSPTDELTVDLSGFILRLVLFEKYILQSRRLREFPALLSAFGYEGVSELLSSNAIDIHCEALTIGQIGQLGIFEPRKRKGLLPLGSYCFSLVGVPDHKQYIHDCLQPLHEIKGLHRKNVKKLKLDIVSRLLKSGTEVDNDIMQQFKTDLRSNVPNIKTAIAVALRDKLSIEINPSDFYIKIDPIDEDDFHTETNISDVFRLSDEEVHHVVERGLLAIGGLNQRIAEMKAYTAISGFRDLDIPLFDEKLKFITRAILPEEQEERLRRVFVIKGFQDLQDLIERGQVDLTKLLEIRETKECKEFREWLFTIDSATDSEIEERINSLSEKLSWFVHGKSGKSVRWIASTGIGLIPVIGNVAGAALGFLDTFLLEKILPNPGSVSFLNRLYPSIFKGDPKITTENFLRVTPTQST